MSSNDDTTTPDFPELDASRTNVEGRVIMDVFGSVEPYLPEVDYWFSMPLRLVHSNCGGWELELGPYTLDAGDIGTLRAAIDAYDEAVGSPIGGHS